MASSLGAAYLKDILRTFTNQKALGDAAIAQVSDTDLHRQIDPGSNSVAVVMKHVGGNLRSRFTDFLTTDGEKPTRDRDAEFEMAQPASRDDILSWWNDGWTVALQAIESLDAEDLMKTVHIRGEEFLVLEALNRSAAHTAYHVGQIAYVARHLAGPRWNTLSIPKGRSADFMKGDFKTSGIVRNRI